jgi:polysaccharide biosynthesis/export protein
MTNIEQPPICEVPPYLAVTRLPFTSQTISSRAMLIANLVWASIFAPGLLAQSAPNKTAVVEHGHDMNSYVLGPNDQVSIWALECDEITGKTFTVDNSGSLSLPLVGRMQVAGLTVEQFEEKLRDSLRKYLYKPEVAVSITDFRSQPVSLTGAVARPGVYQLRGQRRLLDLLTEAGGLRPDAGTIGRLTREPEWGKIPLPNVRTDLLTKATVADINLRSILISENSDGNILLKPHDVISVPIGDMIYVIGEVARPGSLTANEHGQLSVLQAISMAGGLTKGAATKDARILRLENGHPQREEIPVNVARLLAGKSKDMGLEPNDILLIPDSKAKKFRERAVDTAVSVGSSLLTLGLIYR